MKKLLVVPFLAGFWVACSGDDTVPGSNMAGSGGSSGGAAGSSSTSGKPSTSGSSNGTSGSSTTSGSGGGGTAGSPGASGSGGAAGAPGGSGGVAGGGGTGGAGGAGGTTAGSGGMGGNGGSGGRAFPEPTTCAGYAAKFGALGAYVYAPRMVQGDFTLEAWIKTSAPSLTGEGFWQGNGLLYADIGGSNNDFGTSVLNNKLSFGTGNPDLTIVGASDVNSGNWIHIAATRKASTGELEIFLFGNSDGKLTSSNHGALTAQANISFGGNSIDGRYFNGLMDEVRIWSYVRTSAQIKESLHHKLRGDEPGLVGYFGFDNAGEATTPDDSPTAATAMVNGGVDWVDSAAPVCDPIPDPTGEGGAGGAESGGAGAGGTAEGGTGGAAEGGTSTGGAP
jgi:hypothetical protein